MEKFTKKCKTCGTTSKNKTYTGDTNKYNEDNCMQCAVILYMIDIYEDVLNRPNAQGNTRKVKLFATISK